MIEHNCFDYRPISRVVIGREVDYIDLDLYMSGTV